MNPANLYERRWRETIKEKFTFKKQLASHRNNQLFQVFQQSMTEEEHFLMQYLYAYMPLNDLANYDGEMFLSHIRKTLKIRNSVPWGKDVPDDLFLHFVLPYRVNNENIEDSRDLPVRSIVRSCEGSHVNRCHPETNYWCHEKATYTGNDIRTCSPLCLCVPLLVAVESSLPWRLLLCAAYRFQLGSAIHPAGRIAIPITLG